uniref:AlNc14C300G10367 protein n=1 Tax=Albugo laibachii Nc14 TaxID=890382 RepID=F0WVN0_9STRA|nr:AlNc14C300G10367 [Albugo laibachii Nc14]|eukprot:CCA25474.1 AlNc14C300G10367 [Albugo laibachii Nc14]
MNVASKQGKQTSLMNCANACKKLKLDFFRDDIQQYRLLPDYLFKLRQNDHDVILEMEDKQFTRIQIVFREGKQVFKSYAQRGICLDGKFLKNVNGGILLGACVSNGNQQMQIVSVTIVSIENEANLGFFGIWS